jgi:P-type Cu2+ transporter
MSSTLTKPAPATEHAHALPTTADCLHCHLPFRPTKQRTEFCCSGCQFVYKLINRNGLEKYYDLQDGQAQPVKPTVFQPRDYSWLKDLAEQAEEKSPSPSLALDLQGLSCIGCVWLIEQLFERKQGAVSIQINSALGQARLQWERGEFDVLGFARELQSFGYLLAPAAKRENRESRLLVRRMGLTAALAMNCMLFTVPFYFGMDSSFEYAPLFSFLTFFFATASVAVGGTYFIRRSFVALRRKVIHIDLPIALGIVLAYSGSVYAWLHNDHSFIYFDFVTIFTFLMLVGRWTQQLAVERNRNYLLGLRNQQQQVTLITDEPAEEKKERRFSITELTRGMRYAVAPGQFVPVRSELTSPNATFGLEWINGESEAHPSRRGNSVLAGAINLGGTDIELLSRENWQESMLASLLAHDPKEAPRHLLLERIIKIYLVAVLLIAAAGALFWYLNTGDSFRALQVLISVLVVSCPCAIGVAWPLADEMAVSALRQRGVFVRDQSLWHRIARVRKIIFDKTGTLTMENLALRNPEALHELSPRARGVLLHLVESNLHPVSRCLREHLLAEGFDQKGADLNEVPVREVIGAGVETTTAEGTWRLGKPAWNVAAVQSASDEVSHDCQLTLDGRLLGAFSLGEEVRPDAAEEVARWRKQGYEVYILSGDRKQKVRKMAESLRLPQENGLAEMSPSDKAQWIQDLDREDTLMIGDGANDSLAFDRTFCKGTPAVDRGILEEKADFYFLGRGLSGIRNLFETATNRRKTLARVFSFTILYNLGAISLCLTGIMNPLLAAAVMPLSAVISVSSVILQTKVRNRGVR